MRYLLPLALVILAVLALCSCSTYLPSLTVTAGTTPPSVTVKASMPDFVSPPPPAPPATASPLLPLPHSYPTK